MNYMCNSAHFDAQGELKKPGAFIETIFTTSSRIPSAKRDL